jgi:hypothetical protein
VNSFGGIGEGGRPKISAGDRDVLLLVAWAELTSEEAGRALGHPGRDGAVPAAPRA